MVKCGCGKTIDKMPLWLETVQVEFVCNNCPKRSVKSIAQLHNEQLRAQKVEDESLSGISELDEEDEPGD